MNQKEIRWTQRFENYKKAFEVLEKALKIEEPTEIERGGIIQFYEMCFELGWKLLKDYNETQGLITKSPREAIKQAYQTDLIDDGHTWIDALESRILIAHTYDEKTALEVLGEIQLRYFIVLKNLYERFNNI